MIGLAPQGPGATQPELPADAVANELKPHVASLLMTTDALVAGNPATYGALQTSAGQMPGTAATLAGGSASNLKLG